MVKIAGVRFRTAGKIYHFDPNNLEINNGDDVIVETARGIEFGTVKGPVRDIPEKEVAHPLKKILRVANDKDKEKNQDNLDKRADAIKACKEKIVKHELDMKLVDAEYTFDNNKIVFYFTSDGRVDFRELVKDLAGVFKKRIELRQVGVRDEAKLLGGIGTCGKDLCCKQWLQDFDPVSIKMAKIQNLSLNPTKISGSCGRLMCCLKYENANYQKMKKGMPNISEIVDTPEGPAKVMDANILLNQVKTRLIVEEKTEDSQEKLSPDLKIYAKEDVYRRKKHGGKKGGMESVSNEIEEALADDIIDIIKDE